MRHAALSLEYALIFIGFDKCFLVEIYYKPSFGLLELVARSFTKNSLTDSLMRLVHCDDYSSIDLYISPTRPYFWCPFFIKFPLLNT